MKSIFVKPRPFTSFSLSYNCTDVRRNFVSEIGCQHEGFKLSTNNVIINEINECKVASFHCMIVRKYDEIFDLLLVYQPMKMLQCIIVFQAKIHQWFLVKIRCLMMSLIYFYLEYTYLHCCYFRYKLYHQVGRQPFGKFI